MSGFIGQHAEEPDAQATDSSKTMNHHTPITLKEENQ